MDFGEQTSKNIRVAIRKAKKFAWFDSLCLYCSEYFSESNKNASRVLYKMQQDKKKRLEEFLKANNDYNYINDALAFIFGKQLEKDLNLFELVE